MMHHPQFNGLPPQGGGAMPGGKAAQQPFPTPPYTMNGQGNPQQLGQVYGSNPPLPPSAMQPHQPQYGPVGTMPPQQSAAPSYYGPSAGPQPAAIAHGAGSQLSHQMSGLTIAAAAPPQVSQAIQPGMPLGPPFAGGFQQPPLSGGIRPPAATAAPFGSAQAGFQQPPYSAGPFPSQPSPRAHDVSTGSMPPLPPGPGVSAATPRAAASPYGGPPPPTQPSGVGQPVTYQPAAPPTGGYSGGPPVQPHQYASAAAAPPPVPGLAGQSGPPPGGYGFAGGPPPNAAGAAAPPFPGSSSTGFGNSVPPGGGPVSFGGAPPGGGPAPYGGAPPGGGPAPYGGAPPGGGPAPYGGALPSAGSATYGGGAPPGGPPAYGYGGSAMASGPAAGSLPPTAPKRLDPDQMPSPIQVILDDRKSRQGKFQTSGRGLVPPLVTTDFVTEDYGNCNPRYVRSTMYSVPVSNDMMKQAKVPFGLVISPYARLADGEIPPPCINMGDLGPVRCHRCRAYMCAFMQFVDGGRRFACPFCDAVTDVPQEYFSHLDHTGKRTDAHMRPELCLGTYEVLGTKEYCKNGVFPKPPAFIFMIDVSYNSVKSGLLYLLCQHIKDTILPNLPREHDSPNSEIRVGFVTYSNVLHFYNVRGNLALPQMMVVSDVEDVFVPIVDGFLVKPEEATTVIDSLVQQLPTLFAEARETEVVLGPVIQAGMDALKSAGCPGKLFIFHTSLPIANAPGKLKNRDDRKLLGTDKEKTILAPQDSFYTKLGQECVASGCGVDLFLFPNSYIDVATLAEVPRLSGGQVYKYEYFQADINGERFIQDLKNAVQKPIAFDCMVRVRTSTGIRPVDFFGNFHMSNSTDVEMAVLDCDKSMCCEVKHDDKLSENDGAFVQVALLFTSMSGQRKLRIHNLSLNCCSQMSDLFRSCELDTLMNLTAKMALRNTLHKAPKDIREEITVRCCEILAAYRKYCATSSAPGQLILPECMKLLPLYSNCVMRNDALHGAADVSTDDRSYLMHLVNSMDVGASAVFFYPRLIPLHTVDLADPVDVIPDPIRCSIDRLSSNGVYLLENGISMFIWIGVTVSPEIVEGLFGVSSLVQVDTEKSQLPEVDSDLSRRVREIVAAVRRQRQRYMKLTLVRQRDKLEPWFQHFLVEDKDASGSASYVDFLCHVHREIRNLLN